MVGEPPAHTTRHTTRGGLRRQSRWSPARWPRMRAADSSKRRSVEQVRAGSATISLAILVSSWRLPVWAKRLCARGSLLPVSPGIALAEPVAHEYNLESD